VSDGAGGPLAGVSVVELGRFITAPYASRLLADLGATVVKVESPAGDPFRKWRTEEMSPRFVAYNESKRSIAVDLRREHRHGIVHRLVARADVFVHNLRPAAARDLALDYPSLREACPRLVYCVVRGFPVPDDVPTLPAFDAIGQAVTGLMGLLVPAGSPQPVGPALADIVTGLFAAQGILAALYERSRTGRGREVSVSMVDATSSLVAEAVAYFDATGVEPDHLSRARNSQAFGLIGSDGKATVIQLSTPERFWHLLLDAIKRPDLAEDARFATYDGRVRHYGELGDELQKSAAGHTSQEWLDLLVAAGVPCGPIATVAEVSARGVVWGLQPASPTVAASRGSGNGPGDTVLEIARTARRHPPPRPGEDGTAILREAGYTDDEIERMLADGTVVDAGATRGHPVDVAGAL